MKLSRKELEKIALMQGLQQAGGKVLIVVSKKGKSGVHH